MSRVNQSTLNLGVINGFEQTVVGEQNGQEEVGYIYPFIRY
jgi:hypothetical protein